MERRAVYGGRIKKTVPKRHCFFEGESLRIILDLMHKP